MPDGRLSVTLPTDRGRVVSAPSGTGVLVSIFCRDRPALAGFYATAFGFPEIEAVQGPFTTYYDARQVVFTDPEGNVFRISSSRPGVSDLGDPT